jgi:Bacterial Ig-like domain (group 3)
LSSGRATLSTSTLTVGSHPITATYGGDSNCNGSTSPAMTQTVNTAGKTNTTTTVISSLNPSTFGQLVTFTATVSPSAATGTVTFFDGATALGAVTVISGAATLSTSGLAGGTHSITASYGGDSNYNGSTSAALSQTVNKAGTTNTVTSSLNPSTSGQGVTFTATVSPSTATGTVTFRDGAATLGTGTLSAGRATFFTSSLSVASHSITAVYGGDSNYNGSTSPALTQTVNKAATTTTTTSGLNPSTSGQMVTFTATVSPSTATGTVTFFDGATTLGSGTLSGGRATLSTSTLIVGSHPITATYGGDSNCNGSTSPAMTQTVNTAGKTNTTTTLTSSLNPSALGQLVTFTATVSPSAATGTVWFYDGATTLGSGTLSGGIAMYSTSALSVGNHSIAASYAGDTNYNGSATPYLTQTVNTGGKTNTTTTLTSSLNPSTSLQMVTFTAIVSPSAATGAVTFFDGAAALGAAPVISGAATFSTSSLAVGTHSMTASYGGDSNYNGSTSAPLIQTVNNPTLSGDFTISASPSKATVKAGKVASFTVTVTGTGGFTGTVGFSTAGLPATFSPLTVTGSGSTTMSVPTAGRAKGSYTVTVTGTSGTRARSTSVVVSVR